MPLDHHHGVPVHGSNHPALNDEPERSFPIETHGPVDGQLDPRAGAEDVLGGEKNSLSTHVFRTPDSLRAIAPPTHLAIAHIQLNRKPLSRPPLKQSWFGCC